MRVSRIFSVRWLWEQGASLLPALFWRHGSNSLIASFCKIGFLYTLRDPNFIGSLLLALGFVISFFPLIAMFVQGPAGKLISRFLHPTHNVDERLGNLTPAITPAPSLAGKRGILAELISVSR